MNTPVRTPSRTWLNLIGLTCAMMLATAFEHRDLEMARAI
jgi:hypothetical protein